MAKHLSETNFILKNITNQTKNQMNTTKLVLFITPQTNMDYHHH